MDRSRHRPTLHAQRHRSSGTGQAEVQAHVAALDADTAQGPTLEIERRVEVASCDADRPGQPIADCQLDRAAVVLRDQAERVWGLRDAHGSAGPVHGDVWLLT